MKTYQLMLLAVILGCFSQSLGAHEIDGQGSFVNGLLHPWSGLDHVFVAIAIAAWAMWHGDKKWYWLPLVFLLTLIGGMLVPLISSMPLLIKTIALAAVVASMVMLVQDSVGDFKWALIAAIALGLSQGYQHAIEISSLNYFVQLGISLATGLILFVGAMVTLWCCNAKKRAEWRVFMLLFGMGSFTLTLLG